MATSVPGVLDTTLQKFIDGVISTVRSQAGIAPDAAPDAFKTRLQQTVSPNGGEVQITFRTNPNGTAARVRIDPLGCTEGAQAIEGDVDIATLAALLV